MALALALVVIVIGALAFHFWSPWWLTPLASNWAQMDQALMSTLVITGIAFVAINLFVAVAIVKFRHREGHRASPEHGNKKLEWWLIGLTSVGIVAMLAPGLQVYAKLIAPPADAMVFEVMGQQWQWHFRLPGKDGKLGATDVRFMSPSNPFGLDPQDPAGQDDVLVDGQEIHIPIGKPVKVMLRSLDVLHDFYVPEFRTRMNMVPGMVTWFWLTPTREGRFEVVCAQLCGVGHYNMRSAVVVESETAYAAWLATQPTYAHPAGVGGAEDAVQKGRLLAQSRGCAACHSVDGTAGVGPSWKGLFGRAEPMSDGSTVTADDAYLRESILSPQAKIVKGFPPVMPPQTMAPDELDAMVAYIRSLQ